MIVPSTNKVTVLPASATPSIIGLESLVAVSVVVTIGITGNAVSIVIDNESDISDIFPEESAAVTVKE